MIKADEHNVFDRPMPLAKPMVRLVDKADHRMYGWLISRDLTDAQHSSDLDTFNVSLQDFHRLTVHFNASAGFREILSNVPNYVMWSQSSRNRQIKKIPCAEYTYMSSASAGKLLAGQYDLVYKLTEMYDQDRGRIKLPLAHMTEFLYELPVRGWVSLWNTLNEIGAHLYNELYIEPVLAQAGIVKFTKMSMTDSEGTKTMVSQIDFNDEHTSNIMGAYKSLFNAMTIPPDWQRESHTAGDVKIISKPINIGLRAQFARQNRVRLRDNMLLLLEEHGVYGYEMLGLEHPVKVTAIMDAPTYDALCNKRSCFIAQLDIWYDFLEEGYKEKGFPDILPCGGKKECCTNELEAIDCKEDNAVTDACPIYENNRYYFDIRKKNAEHKAVYEFMEPYFESMPYHDPNN